MASENEGFFDGYKDIMLIWFFGVVSFMFLCVSFLRILQRAFLYLPSSFELYDPNEWYNGTKEDPEIHEEAKRFINKKMLKGPQYKKIVLAQWMRIVGVFWLVVSNLAIVCYVGPRVAFCIFEMLLLYWDVVAYSTFSGIATSSFSPLIFILYFAAVIKVLFTSVFFLNPSKETLIRSKFQHSVALLLFHQFLLMFTQLKQTQGMTFLQSDTSNDFGSFLKKKAEFMIFLSIYCMIMITHHQFQRRSKESIGRVEAVLWNSFSLLAIGTSRKLEILMEKLKLPFSFSFSSKVYNVSIIFSLKEDREITSTTECFQINDGVSLASTACFELFDKILAVCGLCQVPLYIWIVFRGLFPLPAETKAPPRSDQ